MKYVFLGSFFLMIAVSAGGCMPKQAPIVDNSTPHARQQRIQQMENDPNLPAAEKAAIVAAYAHQQGAPPAAVNATAGGTKQ